VGVTELFLIVVGGKIMLQSILELFTTAEKAEAMLSSPIIELIFTTLFVLFAVTFAIHLAIYIKIKKVRNYLKDTNRMDIEPLQTFKKDFDRRQSSESIKVETFVEEKFSGWRLFNIPVISLIKLVQMTVSVFILLGVLGTFIGLTISLGSINAGGDQLVENVAGVLSGIDIAFYTSIVGMGFSLIMTVLVKAFNTEYMLTDLMLLTESNLEGHEQQGMNRIIEVSEAINQSIQSLQETNQDSLQSIEESFTGFKDYTAGLEQSAKDLAAFNEGLSSNLEHFQELFDQMKAVTDGFSKGTKELNKNFDSLFSYFKKADQRNERLLKSFEKSTGKMEEVSQAQIDSLSGFNESVGELKNFTLTLLNEQEEVHSALAKIMSEAEDIANTMDAHNKTFKEVFGTDLSAELSGIKTFLGELQSSFEKLGGSVETLPQALDVINQTQAEHKNLLSTRFAELKEFNRKFSDHLINHTRESENFEKHLRDASSTYEQMAIGSKQLIHEIKETSNQISREFSQRNEHLDANLDMVKDTLSNYVANLEGTLGSKLDAVIRNIEDYMNRTSGGIKREFSDIQRQTEDMQQNQARATQQLLGDLGREIQMLNRQLEQLGRQAQTVQMDRRIGMSRNEY